MDEFTKMNIVCLKDLQILLETISDTITKLDNVLLKEYFNMKKHLKENLPSAFILNEDIIKEDFVFPNESNYNDIIELYPSIEVIYTISFEKETTQKKLQSFNIELGYIADKTQNVIFFQLFDISDHTILTSDFISSIKTNTIREWICESDDKQERPNLYVEFKINENFTLDKIRQCSKFFKEYVLHPTLNKLE